MIGERYSLDREVGRGGMGAVWLGRDELLGRAVAIKRVGVMPGGSSPDLLRAEREARIAASLNHPNIVGIFDLVHDQDQQYLVMEYVEGRTLAELVREQGALPPTRAARILTQAASALAAAHANHIVHRDVKPSNILVRDDGHVKLSDFGIARAEADASLTQTGLVTGSPAYLAPEVATGKQATPASDVWSLGATLFHALAGHAPYEVGDNVLGAMYQIVNDPPPRLPDPGEMAPVLLATMAHDPRRRWSMDDVARVLELLASSGVPGAGAARPVDDPPPTRTLHPAPPAPTSAPPEPAPQPEPEPEPAPQPSPSSDRRRRVLPVLVGVVVVALIGVIAVLALIDDPQEPGPSAGPSEQTSPSSPSSAPTSETSEPPDPPPTEADLEEFARNYLQTASSEPAAGFEQLTRRFQRASGGIDGYEGFWGEVSNPRIESISADAQALTVTYSYRFAERGAGVQNDTVTLQLRRQGDRLLIDGEA